MSNAHGDNLMLKKKRSLEDLENSAEFVARHVGPNSADQAAMLDRKSTRLNSSH